jgi:hypothetical protein
VPEFVIIFLWAITLTLAHEEGRLTAAVAGSDETDSTEPDADWLRLWYGVFHSDLQWAKDRSVQSVRFAVLLVGALVASKRYAAFGNVSVPWYIAMVVATGIVAAWHVYDLHRFAARARCGYVRILDKLRDHGHYVPRPGWDPNHLAHLFVKLGIIAVACTLGVLGLLHLAATATAAP